MALALQYMPTPPLHVWHSRRANHATFAACVKDAVGEVGKVFHVAADNGLNGNGILATIKHFARMCHAIKVIPCRVRRIEYHEGNQPPLGIIGHATLRGNAQFLECASAHPEFAIEANRWQCCSEPSGSSDGEIAARNKLLTVPKRPHAVKLLGHYPSGNISTVVVLGEHVLHAEISAETGSVGKPVGVEKPL